MWAVGRGEERGTYLLEALFGLPMEPLVLLTDLDAALRHASPHG